MALICLGKTAQPPPCALAPSIRLGSAVLHPRGRAAWFVCWFAFEMFWGFVVGDVLVKKREELVSNRRKKERSERAPLAKGRQEPAP